MRVIEGVKYIALVGLGPKPKSDKPVNDLEVVSANRLGKIVVGQIVPNFQN